MLSPLRLHDFRRLWAADMISLLGDWAGRLALTKLWAPVGSGVVPKEETAFLVQHLLGGEGGDAWVKKLDQRLERLPGMEGMKLVQGEVQRWYAVAA